VATKNSTTEKMKTSFMINTHPELAG